MLNKINFLGDIMLGERFEKLNRGVVSNIKKGIDPFQFCKSELLNSNINVANLECVVSSNSDRSSPFSKFMLVQPDKLDLLLDNNIKLVNIANNHILDHGEKAFYETRANLDKKGIKYFGFDEGTGVQKIPLEILQGSKKIALLGYNLSNLDKDKFAIKIDEISEILSSLADFDLMILSLHWGYEYTDSPTSYMIKAAEKFFKHGVDFLHGHHPHILQGITNINGKIFAPSLGNFIFDDERKRNRFTGILKLQFENKNNLEYEFYPYLINDYFQPVPNNDLASKFEELSLQLKVNVEKTKNEDIKFDEDIFIDSELGHSNNRKRVRKQILTHFYYYLPFLPQIFKFKIIDKRIKKLFD